MINRKLLLLTGLLSACISNNAYALSDGETFKDWKAVCVKERGKELCAIEQQIFDKEKKLLLVTSVSKFDSLDSLIGRIDVSLGVSLKYGIILAIDNVELGRIAYEACEGSCFAPFPINEQVKDKLKKGSKLTVTFMTRSGEVKRNVSLAGITKALNAMD